MKRLAGVMAATMLALATAACGQTDPGITMAIKAKLIRDDLVKAYQINVTTEDRVVTLEGDVATTVERDRAVSLAREAEGVRDVNDQIFVRETAATSGDAAELGREIEQGLDATGEAVEKGVEATADVVKKAGRAVRDAVTDRDRDTDKDGK